MIFGDFKTLCLIKKKFLAGVQAIWRTVSGNPPLTLSNAVANEVQTYTLNGNTKRTITIDGTEYVIPSDITLYTSVQDTNGNVYTPSGYVYPAKKGNIFGLYHFDTKVFQTEVSA